MTETVSVQPVLLGSLNYTDITISAVDGIRKTVKLVPNANSIFTDIQTISFNIPALGFLDTKNSKLIVEVQATPDAPNIGLCFSNYMECIINRLQWCLGDGSSQIENIQDYNVHAASIFKYKVSQDYADTISGVQCGYSNSITQRQQWASQKRSYALDLIGSGVMGSTLRYIPLGLMARIGGFSRSMTCDIFTEDPQICMVDSFGGTDKHYTITKIYFQLEIIQAPVYEQALYHEIMNNNKTISIPFQTTIDVTNTIDAGFFGQVTQYIPNPYTQFTTGIRTIFFPPQHPEIDYLYSFIQPAGLTGYQYFVKKEWYPNQVLDMSTTSQSQQVSEIMKYFGKNTGNYDQSITNGYNSGTNIQPNILYVNLPIQADMVADTILDLKSSVINNYENSWTVQSTPNYYIIPPSTGFYHVGMTCVSEFVGTGTGNITIDVQLYDTTVPGYVISSGTLTVAVVNFSGYDTMLSFDGIVFLQSSHNYVLRAVINARSSGNVSIINLNFNANMLYGVTNNEVSDNNFMIAQTLRTFYDNLQDLQNNNMFLLDGVDTHDASNFTFRMNLDQPGNATSLKVYHFVDYVGTIAISKNNLNVQK